MKMCFDKRVLIGLGVVAIALLAINPSLFGSAPPILVLLACPLSMVLMMWAMSGRRDSSGAADGRADDEASANERAGTSSGGDEVAGLRNEVARLRAELEQRDTSPTRHASARTASTRGPESQTSR